MAKRATPALEAESMEITMEADAAPGPDVTGATDAAPRYVLADGGPMNYSPVEYVDLLYVHQETRRLVPYAEIAPGEVVGVYAREDLAHGPLMRWQGWQMVKAEQPVAAGEPT